MPDVALIVRAERGQGPRRVDVLEAAAVATLRLQAGRQRSPEHENASSLWSAPTATMVRFARGRQWTARGHCAAVHVSRGTAEVVVSAHAGRGRRASRRRPRSLDQPSDHLTFDGLTTGPRPEDPVIWLAPESDLGIEQTIMQVVKEAACLWEESTPQQRLRWEWSGFPLSVRQASHEQWRDVLASRASRLPGAAVVFGSVVVLGEWKRAG